MTQTIIDIKKAFMFSTAGWKADNRTNCNYLRIFGILHVFFPEAQTTFQIATGIQRKGKRGSKRQSSRQDR